MYGQGVGGGWTSTIEILFRRSFLTLSHSNQNSVCLLSHLANVSSSF